MEGRASSQSSEARKEPMLAEGDGATLMTEAAAAGAAWPPLGGGNLALTTMEGIFCNMQNG